MAYRVRYVEDELREVIHLHYFTVEFAHPKYTTTTYTESLNKTSSI